MKKYIIAMLLLFIPCVTYALTMCARDNSLVISLVSGIVKDYSWNQGEFTWRMNFDYGTLLGEATCLSDAEVEKISSDTPTALYGLDPDGNPRGNCYCRLAHPALSAWQLVIGNQSSEYCRLNCSRNCPYLSNTNQTGYFKSIVQ